MDNPFIGEIGIVAFNYAPRDWAFCSGQTLPINQNTALFALLSDTFGGDGRTTFGLPDLRGRVPVGSRDMGSPVPPIYSPFRGEKSGLNEVAIQIGHLPAHTHDANVTKTETNLAVQQPAVNANGNQEAPGSSNYPAIGNYDSGGMSPTLSRNYSNAAPNTTLPQCEVSGSVSVTIENSPTGGNQQLPIMQPFTGVNYIIALDGIFPPRS